MTRRGDCHPHVLYEGSGQADCRRNPPPEGDAARSKRRNKERGNDREPKYDIREWSPDGQTMSKGVTLSKEELAALRELLNKMEL